MLYTSRLSCPQVAQRAMGTPSVDGFGGWPRFDELQMSGCPRSLASETGDCTTFSQPRITPGKRRRLQDQGKSRSLTYSQTAPQPALENEKPIKPRPPEPSPWHLVPGIVKYGLHFGTRETAFPRKCLQIISLLRRTIIQVGFSPIIVPGELFSCRLPAESRWQRQKVGITPFTGRFCRELLCFHDFTAQPRL